MTIQAPPTPDTPPPAGEPGLSTPSRRLVLGAGIPAVLALGATVALGAPRPAGLGDATGDADLAEALAPHLKGHRRVAAALLDGTDVRHAGFGTDEHGQFEIGSLSKTFTGALVLDGMARGELALDSTVAEILGSSADSSAIADRTIAQLASHSAGIPGLPGDVVSRTLWTNALRKNPYAGFSAEDVIGDALDSTPTEPGPAEYSNLGAALEGQLAAYAADTPWVDLRGRGSSSPSACRRPAPRPRTRTSPTARPEVTRRPDIARRPGRWTAGRPPAGSGPPGRTSPSTSAR